MGERDVVWEHGENLFSRFKMQVLYERISWW
jgi:hypothetical protein